MHRTIAMLAIAAAVSPHPALAWGDISGDVTTVLFPGTARTGLTPDTIAAVTKRTGERF